MDCRGSASLHAVTACLGVLSLSLAAPTRADESVAAAPVPRPGNVEPGRAEEPTIPTHLKRAQALFAEGVARAERGDWRAAAARFLESNRLAERPNTLFNLALAQIELEDSPAAHRSLTRFLELADESHAAEDRAHAQALLSRLEGELARVRLTLEPGHAQLQVDGVSHVGEGERRALVLLPGSHELRAAADGYRPGELRLALSAGQRAQHRLALAPLREAPGASAEARLRVPALAATSPRRRRQPRDEGSVWSSPWLWGGMGVAVVALGVALAVALDNSREPSRYQGSAGVEL